MADPRDEKLSRVSAIVILLHEFHFVSAALNKLIESGLIFV